MHHRVDAGRGRDMGGKAARGLRIEDRQIWQESRADDARLLVFAGGDDGNRRDFGAGSGRGGNHHERQAAGRQLADPVALAKIGPALRQGGSELGDIQRRPAAKAKNTRRRDLQYPVARGQDHAL